MALALMVVLGTSAEITMLTTSTPTRIRLMMYQVRLLGLRFISVDGRPGRRPRRSFMLSMILICVPTRISSDRALWHVGLAQ